MSPIVSEPSIAIDQVHDYEFRVRFHQERIADLVVDETAPLGAGAGPSPQHLLAAAIGNCLTASLLFCLRKSRVESRNIHTEVKVGITRNEEKRLRVGTVEVVIDPHLDAGEAEKARRCAALFEDYCTVTQSIRSGIDVHVKVKGLAGAPE